jgi:Nitroreductase
MPTSAFTVAADKCIQCNACVQDCPRNIISRSGDLPEVLPQSGADCLKCQHCLAVCPTGAVSVLGLCPENSLPLSPQTLPSERQMHTLVRGRRSVRQYKDESVPRATIETLLASVANAPSGCNDRALRFTVVENRAAMQGLLHTIVETLEEKVRRNAPLPSFLPPSLEAYRQNGRDDFFRGAPHLLVVSAGKNATCGKEDIDLALAYFELLAQSAGLGTVWCGYLKVILEAAPELRPCFGLEPDAQYYAMLFGYPAVRYSRTVQQDATAAIQWIPALP